MARYEWDVKNEQKPYRWGERIEVNINYLKGKKTKNIYHDNDISNNNNQNLYV